MKYSIVTSANKSYWPFLDIFIKTALEKCHNLETLYVIDCGLEHYSKQVQQNPKVKIVPMFMADSFDGVHGSGWRKATRSKTLGLLKILKEENIDHPIVLVDSDVAILKDLAPVIKPECDIQATVMSDGGHRRTDGITIKEIACFVVFNNMVIAQRFIKQWSATINYLEQNEINPPHETPSFNFTIKDFEEEGVVIDRLDENTVCADLKIFDHSYSVHFKSNGSTVASQTKNFFNRIRAAVNYSSDKHNFESYLDRSCFKDWLLEHAPSRNGQMNYDDFHALVESLNDQGEFTFGTNWYDYVRKTLSEHIISQHVNDLKSVLTTAGVDVRGRSVFDIGCGSGLSSLAFARLGTGSVYSIDIDPKSVQAAEYTKEHFDSTQCQWDIELKSILSGSFQQYDLVYSWGVLHHTGEMWKAINVAKNSVALGGYLYVALYRSGPTYPQHLAQKQYFASQDREGKIRCLYDYTGGYAQMFHYDNRGMNRFHDAIDWLGGLPYEVCGPDELGNNLIGFERVYFQDGNEGGNFVAVYKRQL